MANSSILCFKRAKSIDSNAFQDEFVENDKINILEANLHLLKKIFCCHSWEKKGGNLITIPEFFKIMMNLKITPKLMKTYTIKEIVNAVVKSKEVINTIKGHTKLSSILRITFSQFKLLIQEIVKTCYSTDLNKGFRSFFEYIKQPCKSYYSITLITSIKRKNEGLDIKHKSHRKSMSSIVSNNIKYSRELMEQQSSPPKSPLQSRSQSIIDTSKFKIIDNSKDTNEDPFSFKILSNQKSGFFPIKESLVEEDPIEAAYLSFMDLKEKKCSKLKKHNSLRCSLMQYNNCVNYSANKNDCLNTSGYYKKEFSEMSLLKNLSNQWKYLNQRDSKKVKKTNKNSDLSLTKHISISLFEDNSGNFAINNHRN